MPRHLRRLAVAAVTVAALPAALATGASASRAVPAAAFKPVPTNQQVGITFLSYLPAAFTQGASTVNGLIASFEASHPNIHVTVESAYPTIPAVQQDAAAGNEPDVVQGTFDGWKYLVSGLGAIDLTKTFGQAQINDEWGGDYPYATPVQQLAVEKGDVYGIPWTLSTPVLFYNANLFEKAGLSPSDPPTTWAALKADAQKIKAATGASGLENGCIGLGVGTTLSDWCLQAIIDSAGGRLFNASGTKLNFDNSGTVYAMKVMKDLANSGVMVNLTGTQAYQAFASGKLAMMLQTSAVQATLLGLSQGGNFTLLDAKMPGFGAKPTAPTNSGSGLFILSKDSLKQRAAWELVRYLTSDAAMTTITESIGYPPLRPGLANSPTYLGAWKRTNTLVKANLAQLKVLVPYQGYPGPNYSQIVDTLANAATSIVFENGNSKSLLASAQSTAASMLQ